MQESFRTRYIQNQSLFSHVPSIHAPAEVVHVMRGQWLVNPPTDLGRQPTVTNFL